jgi:hypothetical protein
MMLTLKSLMGQQQLHGLQTQQLTRNMNDEQTLRDIYRGAIKAGRHRGPARALHRPCTSVASAPSCLPSRRACSRSTRPRRATRKDNATANKDDTEALKTKLHPRRRGDQQPARRPRRHGRPRGADTIANLVQTGVIDQIAGRGDDPPRSRQPGGPALRQFLMQKGLEVMDAQKRMELLTPKVEYKHTGKHARAGGHQLHHQPQPAAAGQGHHARRGPAPPPSPSAGRTSPTSRERDARRAARSPTTTMPERQRRGAA